MKIKCGKCRRVFVEGDIIINKKRKKAFMIKGECKGEIYKMNSNNPRDWSGRCSSCQK